MSHIAILLVTDADPNYLDVTYSNSSSISTTTVGTYTIEYYSDKDGAGNVPFNKTRTVSVQSSSLTADASYVDSETILLRFDTVAPAFYSSSVNLTSAITVDGQSIKSAIVPGPGGIFQSPFLISLWYVNNY